MACRTIHCSRYVNEHMVKHNESTEHPVALSFSDASFWCYKCESYIDAPSLRACRVALSAAKFAMPQAKEEAEKK